MHQQILEHGPELRRRILFGLIVAIPLVFSRFFFDVYNVPKLGLLMMGVALVAGIRAIEILQGAPAEGLKRLLVPAAAILVPLAIAWAASPYKGWALFGQHSRFQGLVPYLVIVAFGILVADAFGGRPERAAWALAVAGGVVGGYALVQRLGLDPFPLGGAVDRQASSTIGNPNFTGGFLAICLAPALAHAWTRRELVTRESLIAALVLIGLILSSSQGAWGAAAGASVLGVGLLLSGRWPRARVAGAAGTVLIGGAMVGGIILGITNYESERIPLAAKDRGRYWSQAVSMIRDDALIGRGPNAFAIEGVQHRPARDVVATSPFDVADDPHNVALQWGTSAGLLGVAGFVVLLLWFGWNVRKVRSDELWGLALAAGAAAYFLQALVSIDEVTLRVGLWVCLGGLAASFAPAPLPIGVKQKKRKASAPPGALKSPVASAMVAIAALAAVTWTSLFLLSDIRMRNGILLFREIQYLTGSDEFEKAVNFRDEARYRYTFGFQSGMAAEDGGTDGIPFARQRDEQFRYLSNIPDVSALRDYAQLLNRWSVIDSGAAQRAGDLYVRATTLDPVNPVLQSEAVVVLLPLGRETEAEAILQRHVTAIHEDPVERTAALADAWTNAADALLADEEAARFALAKALALDPTNERAMQILQTLDAEAEG